jgi:DNA-binding FrmR family transcriptional regulator
MGYALELAAMLDSDTTRSVRARLRRIAGQVAAIDRMVGEDRPCTDVVHQLAAVQAALSKVGKVVLTEHVGACVADALRDDDARGRKGKLNELMAVFCRYGQLRER